MKGLAFLALQKGSAYDLDREDQACASEAATEFMLGVGWQYFHPSTCTGNGISLTVPLHGKKIGLLHSEWYKPWLDVQNSWLMPRFEQSGLSAVCNFDRSPGAFHPSIISVNALHN